MPRAPENPQAAPIVCYVTDSSSLAVSDRVAAVSEGTSFSSSNSGSTSQALAPEARLLDRIVAATEAGANWIQLREKSWHGRALLDFALQIRARLATPPKLIINDRLDIALTASADGIQLGASSIPLAEAIQFLRGKNAPPHFLICASCHSLEEARAAHAAGATHILFGPVFDSPSKRHFGPPQGLARLAEITAAVRTPVIAIGGITASNAHSCLAAGAQGVAAIREFQDVMDSTRARRFVEAVKA